MVLSETFGETGTAVNFFGGQWWLVGLFLLLLFIVFLLAYKVSSEAIIFFIVAGLTSVGSYQLFIINESITQTVLLISFMFIGSIVYLWISK